MRVLVFKVLQSQTGYATSFPGTTRSSERAPAKLLQLYQRGEFLPNSKVFIEVSSALLAKGSNVKPCDVARNDLG
jgi:hypothetical protein